MKYLWSFLSISVSVAVILWGFNFFQFTCKYYTPQYTLPPLSLEHHSPTLQPVPQFNRNGPCDQPLTIFCLDEQKSTDYTFQEAEALGSLYAALEMKKAGKNDKALKLFKHAIALAPKHPDILNHYGEFLEEINDIVLADQLYFKALTYAPHHEKALQNRQRTATIVEDIDGSSLREIDKKRDLLSTIPDSNAALRRTKKEAYILNVFHSVAIEGNTMSLAETRSVLETRMAISGKSIDEHNEILGVDLAMKYLNSTLVNRIGRITINDILELHKRVLGPVDPVEAGQFRRNQVYVGSHIPPGPDQITLLINQFTEWLNSDSVCVMHPIRFAAIAHYKLVYIHPFTDGNGRTSRLLMNMILMQAGFPPVIIPKQYRHRYYETLQMANEGDVRPFIRFIAQCADLTLDMYLWTTYEYKEKIPALAQDKIINHGTAILQDNPQDTIKLSNFNDNC